MECRPLSLRTPHPQLAAINQLPGFSIVSFFEASWRWVLLAVAAIPVVLFLLFTIGMPIVAKPVAQLVPDSVKERLDLEFIELLDREVMEDTELMPERQDEIREIFNKFSWAADSKLLFRKGGAIGANALALPGGTVVITDELLGMVEHDGEIVAVLAHEVGHVFHNHSMRILVQSAGVSLVMGWLLGDLSLVTDFVLVGAPVLLQQLSYSRKLETEADNFALRILETEGYSAQCFSSLMQKLYASHDAIGIEIPDYLSSHPSMKSRIDRGTDGESCSHGMSEINWNRKKPETIN